MPDFPQSDLERAISHEPDQRFPDSVTVVVTWRDAAGNERSRKLDILGDQFFGRGTFGAPITGDWMVSAIERMRRQGPPAIAAKSPPQRKAKPASAPFKKGPRSGTPKEKARQRRS